MKISLLERITLLITAAALLFLAGWFCAGRYAASRAFVLTETSAPTQTATPTPTPAPPTGAKVNINTADAQALQTLPGIGEKRAADIIAYREANGPFPVPEALTDVPGIGEAILNQCLDLITVEE